MRTTLTLEADAFNAAKAKRVSELVLREPKRSQRTGKSSGVFRSNAGCYTSKDVEAALLDYEHANRHPFNRR
jgi:hypothetical protein